MSTLFSQKSSAIHQNADNISKHNTHSPQNSAKNTRSEPCSEKNFSIHLDCKHLTQYYAIVNKYIQLGTNRLPTASKNKPTAITGGLFLYPKTDRRPSSGIQPDRQKDRYRDHEHRIVHCLNPNHIKYPQTSSIQYSTNKAVSISLSFKTEHGMQHTHKINRA